MILVYVALQGIEIFMDVYSPSDLLRFFGHRESLDQLPYPIPRRIERLRERLEIAVSHSHLHGDLSWEAITNRAKIFSEWISRYLAFIAAPGLLRYGRLEDMLVLRKFVSGYTPEFSRWTINDSIELLRRYFQAQWRYKEATFLFQYNSKRDIGRFLHAFNQLRACRNQKAHEDRERSPLEQQHDALELLSRIQDFLKTLTPLMGLSMYVFEREYGKCLKIEPIPSGARFVPVEYSRDNLLDIGNRKIGDSKEGFVALAREVRRPGVEAVELEGQMMSPFYYLKSGYMMRFRSFDASRKKRPIIYQPIFLKFIKESGADWMKIEARKSEVRRRFVIFLSILESKEVAHHSKLSKGPGELGAEIQSFLQKMLSRTHHNNIMSVHPNSSNLIEATFRGVEQSQLAYLPPHVTSSFKFFATSRGFTMPADAAELQNSFSRFISEYFFSAFNDKFDFVRFIAEPFDPPTQNTQLMAYLDIVNDCLAFAKGLRSPELRSLFHSLYGDAGFTALSLPIIRTNITDPFFKRLRSYHEFYSDLAYKTQITNEYVGHYCLELYTKMIQFSEAVDSIRSETLATEMLSLSKRIETYIHFDIMDGLRLQRNITNVIERIERYIAKKVGRATAFIALAKELQALLEENLHIVPQVPRTHVGAVGFEVGGNHEHPNKKSNI